MKYLLSPEALNAMALCAYENALLAFDFDGTLAPIMEDREGVQMRSETAALFKRVCSLYRCAVISGRSRDDVSSRLGGAPVRHVVGNHGIEMGSESLPTLARPIARARAFLGMALSQEEGVSIEDKQFSLSLHYRNARCQRQARAAILEAVQSLPDGLLVMPGRKVINVLPRGAPHKGDSLLRLRAMESATSAMFVGDDVTDEDAFSVDRAGWLLSVRVGFSLTSSARYYVREQLEIDDLLAWLIAFRQGRQAPYGAT